jgi:hypothetical protein
MKYRGILCTGHPRSGTHYITALISINFLDDMDYFKIYRNHEFPDLVKDQDIAYFHIWRDFEAMASSIYILKERFGLRVGSYEQFLKSRYSDMWRMGDLDKVVTNASDLYRRAQIKGISDFFKGVAMKPREFWEHYNGVWKKCSDENPNVVSVKYGDMMEDFKSTMAYIAARLGSDLTEVKNIDRKVGWWK